MVFPLGYRDKSVGVSIFESSLGADTRGAKKDDRTRTPFAQSPAQSHARGFCRRTVGPDEKRFAYHIHREGCPFPSPRRGSRRSLVNPIPRVAYRIARWNGPTEPRENDQRPGLEERKRPEDRSGAQYRERLSLVPSTFTGSRSALECAFAPSSPSSLLRAGPR